MLLIKLKKYLDGLKASIAHVKKHKPCAFLAIITDWNSIVHSTEGYTTIPVTLLRFSIELI